MDTPSLYDKDFSLLPLDKSYAKDILNLVLDENVSKRNPLVAEPTLDAIQDLISRWQNMGDTRHDWIIEKDGIFAGRRSLYGIQHGRALIGAALFPEFTGQGIGSESARRVAKWAFTTCDIHRIAAHTDVDNLASRKALEKAALSLKV